MTAADALYNHIKLTLPGYPPSPAAKDSTPLLIWVHGDRAPSSVEIRAVQLARALASRLSSLPRRRNDTRFSSGWAQHTTTDMQAAYEPLQMLAAESRRRGGEWKV